MILSKPNHIKIYGHRGARGDLPENTLESFKYLFENNINAYEADILISKDLIPVVTHDFRLDPSFTKDNEGNWIEDENIKIFDLTYEELLKFDIGSLNKLSRYGRRFVNQKPLENQRIPKHSELLALSSKNISENLLINLEINISVSYALILFSNKYLKLSKVFSGRSPLAPRCPYIFI